MVSAVYVLLVRTDSQIWPSPLSTFMPVHSCLNRSFVHCQFRHTSWTGLRRKQVREATTASLSTLHSDTLSARSTPALIFLCRQCVPRGRPASLTLSQPTNHPTNQPTSHPTPQPTNRGPTLNERTLNDRPNEPTNQPADRPSNQPRRVWLLFVWGGVHLTFRCACCACPRTPSRCLTRTNLAASTRTSLPTF